MIKKYSVFSIGQIYFGLDVDVVKEVLPFQPLTKLPNVPDNYLGLFNWRGLITHVIDICNEFGLNHTSDPANQMIMILEIENMRFGILSDKIYDIVSYNEKKLLETEETGYAQYLNGIIQHIEYQKINIIKPERLKTCAIL